VAPPQILCSKLYSNQKSKANKIFKAKQGWRVVFLPLNLTFWVFVYMMQCCGCQIFLPKKEGTVKKKKSTFKKLGKTFLIDLKREKSKKAVVPEGANGLLLVIKKSKLKASACFVSMIVKNALVFNSWDNDGPDEKGLNKLSELVIDDEKNVRELYHVDNNIKQERGKKYIYFVISPSGTAIMPKAKRVR
jgi:hypothetical protein